MEVYSDIDKKLECVGGDLKKVINIDAIVQGIIFILMTQKGERIMLPEFGTNLPAKVFESMDKSLFFGTLNSLKNEILRWDDRILDVLIDGEFNEDKNEILLKIGLTLQSNPTDMILTTTIVKY